MCIQMHFSTKIYKKCVHSPQSTLKPFLGRSQIENLYVFSILLANGHDVKHARVFCLLFCCNVKAPLITRNRSSEIPHRVENIPPRVMQTRAHFDGGCLGSCWRQVVTLWRHVVQAPAQFTECEFEVLFLRICKYALECAWAKNCQYFFPHD